MKKNKFIALALAAGMTFCNVAATGVVAYAEVPTSQTISDNNAVNDEGKYTISVASDDTHTYTVYQILTGSLVAGETRLGNPTWGADAKGTGNVEDFITKITASGLSNAAISKLVEDELKKDENGNITASGQGVVKSGDSNSIDVAPGYYLIKDTTETLDARDSYSLNIVAVFNDITITPKKGTTTSDKKIDDRNDSDTDEHIDDEVWEDSADYDIGDAVPFRLSATIAEDYANYTNYKLTFHDKMDDGLTFNEDTVKVFVETTEIEKEYFTVGGATSDDTFTVHFDNLKDITSIAAGSKIYVTFSATLNENAKIGSEGNENKSHITYSNNPNDSQGGENGKTPDDTVIAFTYQAVFDKFTIDNGVKKHLTGAGFTLYKVKDNITDEQVAALNEGDSLIVSSYKADISAGKYDDEENEVEASVFTFKGIDDGTYVLVETTTPAGYNTASNLKFVVKATHDSEADAPKLTKLTGNLSSGVVDALKTEALATDDNAKTAEIENKSGTILPSTGGMGTTILYVIGGILVIGGGAAIFIKRKKDAE